MVGERRDISHSVDQETSRPETSEARDHGLQVFDLRVLGSVSSPPLSFPETAHYDAFGSAHNLVINEASVPTALDEYFYTRAGSFSPDKNGFLTNTAGFYLMGYDLLAGPLSPVVNGYTGLEVVNVFNLALQAKRLNCGLIHVSTDYVFKGNKPIPEAYTENDPATAIQTTSRDAALVILGMQPPLPGMEDEFFKRTESLVGALQRVALVRSAGGMRLES